MLNDVSRLILLSNSEIIKLILENPKRIPLYKYIERKYVLKPPKVKLAEVCTKMKQDVVSILVS